MHYYRNKPYAHRNHGHSWKSTPCGLCLRGRNHVILSLSWPCRTLQVSTGISSNKSHQFLSSLCLSVYLSVCVCLSVSLSVYVYLCMFMCTWQRQVLLINHILFSLKCFIIFYYSFLCICQGYKVHVAVYIQMSEDKLQEVFLLP